VALSLAVLNALFFSCFLTESKPLCPAAFDIFSGGFLSDLGGAPRISALCPQCREKRGLSHCSGAKKQIA
jgi:hypothetical protein